MLYIFGACLAAFAAVWLAILAINSKNPLNAMLAGLNAGLCLMNVLFYLK